MSRSNNPDIRSAPTTERLPTASDQQGDPNTTRSRNGERLVKKRDRRITSCTQCRDRKLRCSKDQPCLRCLDSGEDCIYVANASDLSKLPKRVVKKRKRAIKVCQNCRERKIPCNKGSPCSACLVDKLNCVYQRFHDTNTLKDEKGAEVQARVQTAKDKERISPAQRSSQTFINSGHMQLLPNTQHHHYPDSFQHGLYGHFSMPPLPPRKPHQYPQYFGNLLPFADHHTPQYEDEGYGSSISGSEMIRDLTYHAQMNTGNTGGHMHGLGIGGYINSPNANSCLQHSNYVNRMHSQAYQNTYRTFHTHSQSLPTLRTAFNEGIYQDTTHPNDIRYNSAGRHPLSSPLPSHAVFQSSPLIKEPTTPIKMSPVSYTPHMYDWWYEMVGHQVLLCVQIYRFAFDVVVNVCILDFAVRLWGDMDKNTDCDFLTTKHAY